VRRSRRHFEAAGLSQEEVQDQMASIWRGGAFRIIVLGTVGLIFAILALDVLAPAPIVPGPWEAL
jgi:hypothetical protein